MYSKPGRQPRHAVHSLFRERPHGALSNVAPCTHSRHVSHRMRSVHDDVEARNVPLTHAVKTLLLLPPPVLLMFQCSAHCRHVFGGVDTMNPSMHLCHATDDRIR
jgi:hypothetical protein